MENKQISNIFLKNNRTNFICVLFFMICLGVLNIATAFLFKNLADTAMGGTYEGLKKLIYASIIFLMMYVLISCLKTIFMNRYVYEAMTHYKNYILHRILKKKINAFNTEVTGKYISELTNDVLTIENNYVQGSINIIYQTFLLVSGIGVMLYLNWMLTLCTIIAAMIPVMMSVIIGDRLSVQEKKVSDMNSGFVEFINDVFKGFSIIKSFKVEEQIFCNYKSKNSLLEKSKKERSMVANFVNIISFSSSFIVTVVVCGVGVYLSIKGSETLGTVIAFIQLLDYVVNPIQELSPAIANRRAAKLLIGKALEESGQNINEDFTVTQIGFNEGIKLSHVSFAYESKKVLDDISVEFKKGESYAIVGQSGSGKTTLLNMLMGYHSVYSGEIKIDGQDILNVSPQCLYDLITIIQQNVFIFDDSILKNITMYREYDASEIKEAIEKAGLSKLVEDKGLDYQCGENGNNLSGGEKQRISIARALLNKTSVLLVDEATAALDSENTKNIMESILNLKEMTRIVITHNLNNQCLAHFNHILVMKNGKIVETGQFEELYNRKEFFYSLVNTYSN